MTWLGEFGQVIEQAAHLKGMGRVGSPGAARAAMLGGDPAKLLEAFPGGVRIDDPMAGRVEGTRALKAYVEQADAWLKARTPRPRHIASTEGASRVVGEFEVDLTEGDRRLTLPIGVVVEPSSEMRGLWIRIYHSQWPLLGRHVLRPPLLERDPSAREADVVGAYQTALAAGDAAGCVATFESDGCFREPSGPQYRVCGTADLTEFYTRFFSAGGGIILEHCTVTEDGVRSALEFNAVRWGGFDLPHQAGVAVYERGRTGKIAHARVYDDVEGPVE